MEWIAASDLRMNDCGTHDEYICTWIHDILAASNNAHEVFQQYSEKSSELVNQLIILVVTLEA